MRKRVAPEAWAAAVAVVAHWVRIALAPTTTAAQVRQVGSVPAVAVAAMGTRSGPMVWVARRVWVAALPVSLGAVVATAYLVIRADLASIRTVGVAAARVLVALAVKEP
jgi:hypothetical protein